MPRNFSWPIPGCLCGLSLPTRAEQIVALAHEGVALIVTLMSEGNIACIYIYRTVMIYNIFNNHKWIYHSLVILLVKSWYLDGFHACLLFAIRHVHSCMRYFNWYTFSTVRTYFRYHLSTQINNIYIHIKYIRDFVYSGTLPPDWFYNTVVESCYAAVVNYQPPTFEDMNRIMTRMEMTIKGGGRVAVHCGGGKGISYLARWVIHVFG